ncbi:MAG TPA: glycosyltransferase 87 family protein [Gaiellaceae bacterium]|nr:glycosyltransferase 87 family protein [Gaiellaceae bacterium]
MLVVLAVATAYPSGSPLVPEHDAPDGGWAWAYLVAAAAAFAAYVGGLLLLARARPARLGAVLALAFAVQLAPLAGPVLLSTDVYTYWDYGRIGAVHGGNPYVDEPSRYPDDPAFPLMGAQWRDTTSVYGPAFTLASEGHAEAVGESPDAAAWAYKVLAALAMLALTLLAVRLSPRPAYAAAFVGWNPLLALHFAGGGHNDAWMMALVLAALALGAAGRRWAAGAAWALAIAIKWLPLVFLPLRYLEGRRRGRRVGHVGFALTAAVVAAVASLVYGGAWLGAFGPLRENLVEERAAYSIPSRLAGLGVPEEAAVALFAALFVLAYVWLLREAWRGRARLGLAAGLLLVTTSWLVPWYAVWAVPLAAVEEDPPARWLALALCAYLLRDAVPL